MAKRKLGQRLMVVYGPPGTGKTTRLLDLYASEVEHGTPADKVALVTFSKAAQLEAAERAAVRLDLPPEELPWIRTLHSIAYQTLGLSREQVYTSPRHAEFCRQEHYRLTAVGRGQVDDPDPPPHRTRDDQYRLVHEWSLQRDVPVEAAWREAPGVTVTLGEVIRYISAFTGWKRRRNIYDFYDLLLEARRLSGPPVDVCFIDEAQDLTPLQLSLVYRWFGRCARVYVVGDDDQGIYDWNGADPTWLIGLRTTADHYEILTQSYRVPEACRAVAARIISTNRSRVPKEYRSARPGGVVRCTGRRAACQMAIDRALEPGWSCLVLVRNRVFATEFCRDLQAAGVPYTSEVPPTGPLSRRKLCSAVLAARDLIAGRAITGRSLRHLLRLFSGPECKALMPRDTDKRAKGRIRPIGASQLAGDWGLGWLVDRLRTAGPALGLWGERYETLAYLDKVLRATGDLSPDPPICVTTVHGAKGREADTVIILPDMARASWQDYDKHPERENRVAYVAVTRARHEMILCDPQGPLYYPYTRIAQHVLRPEEQAND
ncbi:MAG: ATP-dependent helicase [Gammaproteobacteria bacterium]|nr:ATP-dependent helicase [Gammaproteobacteria bacterium]